MYNNYMHVYTQPSAVMDDSRLTIIRPVSNMMGGMYPKFRAQGMTILMIQALSIIVLYHVWHQI